MLSKKIIILDFDGTITDAEVEGKPYKEGYIEDLALIIDKDLSDIQNQVQEIEEEIHQNAQNFGWIYNDKIVAPATVDPYLRVMPIARILLERNQINLDPYLRDRILDRILYKYNYPKTTLAFKDGAQDFFRFLSNQNHIETYVITNSHTLPVQEKIRVLGEKGEFDWLVQRVFGSAKKYVVDSNWNASFQAIPLPSEMQIPSLQRPVYLQRKHYFEAITKICATHNVQTMENLLVIGDIFELDLALPLTLGANVALMTNDHTPQYEKDFLATHPKGTLVSNLNDVSTLIQTTAFTK